jgi:hypothetical protein
MQLARSMFERITAQAILPMTTLGVSGAIAVAVMELLRSFREQRVLAAARLHRPR